jgi:hypothetical protein
LEFSTGPCKWQGSHAPRSGPATEEVIMRTPHLIHVGLSVLTVALGLGTFRSSSFAGLSGPTASALDAPLEQPDAEDAPADCNAADDDATELDAVTCGPPSLGIPCMQMCAVAGRSCAAGLPHPYSPSTGMGQLAGCCSCKGTGYCEYLYGNGDRCRLFPEKGRLWLCGYSGGR